jgi:multiple antibiotic resistance protein
MSDAVNTFLLVFAGLFPVVNPLGSAPIFLILTSGCAPQERDRLASAVAFNGSWLLLGSVVFGSAILEFFGITVPVVRVAGGIVVTPMSWRLLNDDRAPPEREAINSATQPLQTRDSFYPLTMPLTVGPGSISVAITIRSHRPSSASASHTILLAVAAVAGLIAISATVYVCYRFAERLARVLGRSGINVLLRLSAFILMCIGIEIAWSGVKALLATLGQPA